MAAGGNENVDLTTISYDDTSPDNGTTIGNMTVRMLNFHDIQHSVTQGTSGRVAQAAVQSTLSSSICMEFV